MVLVLLVMYYINVMYDNLWCLLAVLNVLKSRPFNLLDLSLYWNNKTQCTVWYCVYFFLFFCPVFSLFSFFLLFPFF